VVLQYLVWQMLYPGPVLAGAGSNARPGHRAQRKI